MEVFRLCLVFLVTNDDEVATFRHRTSVALRSWVIYLVIPVGFAVWRFLLFTSQRKATDLGAQLGALQSDPLSTGLHWLVNAMVSFINVSLGGLGGPADEQLLFGVFAGDPDWIAHRSGRGRRELALPDRKRQHTQGRLRTRGPQAGRLQAVWLGLAGLVLGIAPDSRRQSRDHIP